MLTVLTRVFRSPDLRGKVLFTLGIIVLFRLGQLLPAPGVDIVVVRRCLGSASGGVFDMVQLLSGGAMLQLSVFALGVMPYITASIVMQLLAVVIPRLDALRKEGQNGQAKITQYTRYATVGLAVLNAGTIVALARTGQLLPGCSQPLLRDDGLLAVTVIVLTMVAGTCAVMWMGELITERGVGNGMSLLIFTQVVAVFPAYLSKIFVLSPVSFVVMIGAGLCLVAAVVFVEQAQRRVPVSYAKQLIGKRMYGGRNTYIPMKVNQAGIVPVIFTSSLLYLPSLAAPLLGPEARAWVELNLTAGTHPLYMTAYVLLIAGFAYFYVSITFNPEEVADGIRKYGGFVPGIRPGRPTAAYLAYVLSRLTAPGALYLGVLALLPLVAFAILRDPGTQQNFPFGGTSILIMVGVGLDTVKQIEAQLQQRNYEGFLK
ncbi:preprotein translocase subunit SecY [Nonomuraea gerenzanensis]|uniref:Protein translocase subunit SecY n=1 Tax=Nonomuraea gerenzanensis TaxID=93944 RepID=A0A1M4E685_9ACTN|nr:preprotein translocase subunit SecY [Nonomuraea gerenzanensis]UBU16465.1 preprotein translocase subunit SecY [Nonomuraea gerenzanensis]SBO94284.1 Preprotein translocase secY subunit (TC 3.A.5.1.1) [Nonomuraea gerenzanensis]